MKFTTAFALSLTVLFFWWAFFTCGPRHFTGMGIAGTLPMAEHSRSFNTQIATLSNWPESLHPLPSWLILGTYQIILRPIFIFAEDAYLFQREFPIALVSTTLLTFAYLLTFTALAMQFSSFYGLLALFSLALTPFLVPHFYGLKPQDAFALLFWTWALQFLSKPDPKSRSWPAAQPFAFAVIAGLLGTWIMETAGLALSMAFFVMVLARSSNEKPRPYAFMGLGAGAGSLSALGISFVFIQRHSGTAIFPQTTGGHFLKVAYGVGSMLFVPILMGCFSLIVPSFLKETWGRSARGEQNQKIIFSSIACATGFLATIPLQIYTANMTQEWTRQLMPLSLFATWGAAAFWEGSGTQALKTAVDHADRDGGEEQADDLRNRF